MNLYPGGIKTVLPTNVQWNINWNRKQLYFCFSEDIQVDKELDNMLSAVQDFSVEMHVSRVHIFI